MGDLFLLSEARIAPYFPLSHGVPRVDDRRVVSGIVYVIKHGLQWKDATREYGPPKTLYNRFIRWSRLCIFDRIFDRIFAALAGEGPKPEWIMIDPSESASDRGKPPKKRFFPLYRSHERRAELQTPRGLRRRRQAAGYAADRGAESDHTGARLMLEALPEAKAMIADCGYDSDWFRAALAARGTEPCIPPTRSRKKPLDYDRTLFRQRHKLENLFAKLKD